MSRAFVKEAEDTVEDFPERAIFPHRNLVTTEGYAAIEEALARFENSHREAIANNDAHAAAAAMRESATGGPARNRGSHPAVS